MIQNFCHLYVDYKTIINAVASLQVNSLEPSEYVINTAAVAELVVVVYSSSTLVSDIFCLNFLSEK